MSAPRRRTAGLRRVDDPIGHFAAGLARQAGPNVQATGRSGAARRAAAQAGNAERSASPSTPGSATTQAFTRRPSSDRISRTAASRTSGCPASTSATCAGNTFMPPTCTAPSMRPAGRKCVASVQSRRSCSDWLAAR
nr:hypothetical protein [Massilia putida]